MDWEQIGGRLSGKSFSVSYKANNNSNTKLCYAIKITHHIKFYRMSLFFSSSLSGAVRFWEKKKATRQGKCWNDNDRKKPSAKGNPSSGTMRIKSTSSGFTVALLLFSDCCTRMIQTNALCVDLLLAFLFYGGVKSVLFKWGEQINWLRSLDCMGMYATEWRHSRFGKKQITRVSCTTLHNDDFEETYGDRPVYRYDCFGFFRYVIMFSLQGRSTINLNGLFKPFLYSTSKRRRKMNSHRVPEVGFSGIFRCEKRRRD